MPTVTRGFVRGSDVLESEIVTECYVAKAVDGIEDEGFLNVPDSMRCFKAVWDTGATHTVISPHVVKECDLEHRGWTDMDVVNTREEARTFLIAVGLPNGVVVSDILAAEGEAPGCDVLIGMDIISMGDFVLTHREGQTEFMFQVPSRVQIEKVLELEYDEW